MCGAECKNLSRSRLVIRRDGKTGVEKTHDVIFDADVAGSLTELAPVRVDQQREMRKLWSGETERVVQLQVLRGRGKPFLKRGIASSVRSIMGVGQAIRISDGGKRADTPRLGGRA